MSTNIVLTGLVIFALAQLFIQIFSDVVESEYIKVTVLIVWLIGILATLTGIFMMIWSD